MAAEHPTTENPTKGEWVPVRSSHSRRPVLWLFAVAWDRISCSPGWPLPLNLAKDDLEVLGWRVRATHLVPYWLFPLFDRRLLQPPKCWGYRCEPPRLACLLKISDCTGCQGDLRKEVGQENAREYKNLECLISFLTHWTQTGSRRTWSLWPASPPPPSSSCSFCLCSSQVHTWLCQCGCWELELWLSALTL